MVEVPRVWIAKSTMQVVPAVRGGAGAGLEGVGGLGAPEGHLVVGVGVHAARNDEPARRVDDPVGGHDEIPADEGDGLPLDEDVGLVVVRRGRDAAVPDEYAHPGSPGILSLVICRMMLSVVGRISEA